MIKVLPFLFLSVYFSAQNSITGKLYTEEGIVLSSVVVMNMRTARKAISDQAGSFSIEGQVSDEIRFIKTNYYRKSIIVSYSDFSDPLSIYLVQVPTQIEEVIVERALTGDLNKDHDFAVSTKAVKLNEEMREYLKKPLKETVYSHATPSSFAPRDLSQGQIPLFGIGGKGGLVGLILEKVRVQNEKPNSSGVMKFYSEMNTTFYNEFLNSYGFDAFEFEKFVIYTDKNYGLSEKYWNNFNEDQIRAILYRSVKDYLKLER